MWAAVLVSCFVAGCLITVVVLRARARGARARLRSELACHNIVWGAQIRWRRFNRGWGESGVLKLSPSGELTWRPDEPSSKRGAAPSSWRSPRLRQIASRRDVSGAKVVEYQLLVDGRAEGRFGAFHIVGQLPAALTAASPEA